MPDDDLTGAYHEAIRRGFSFARELGSGCRPVHFLVGVSEGDGAAAHALQAARGRSLRAIVAATVTATNSAGYLHVQAQEAARSLARSRRQEPAPEHLLVALIDQGDQEVAAALRLAGLDILAVRGRALAAIGAAAGEPPLPRPAPAPAGTMDRPPLPVADLDPRAWAVLRWRQDHLPVQHVRGRAGAQALGRLEWDAAWRLADRLQLRDDQRFSLLKHHGDQVRQRAGLAGPRPPRKIVLPRHPVIGVTVGWGAWLGNRQASVRYRWLRLRTLGEYRDCPKP